MLGDVAASPAPMALSYQGLSYGMVNMDHRFMKCWESR